jgi:hypothetical protein
MTTKTPMLRIAFTVASLALATVPAALAAKGGSGTSGGSSGCSISPGQVVLDQNWTVTASGLPGGIVNLIVTVPNGASLTNTITVASNGTYTATGSSNMMTSWGFVQPEQTGTYTYQFVGKVRWPAGTFTQSYAKCSVAVS